MGDETFSLADCMDTQSSLLVSRTWDRAVNRSTNPSEERTMRHITWKIYFKVRELIESEQGQDLVEYALIVALISLAAIVSMKALASDISHAFTSIGSALTTAQSSSPDSH
jgi:pilus assembly protein Flp/PilA